MKWRILWVLLAASLAATSHAGPTNSPLNQVTSLTRQFTAYAPGPVLPTALCVFAERLKRDWLNRLEVADEWQTPIVLVYREAAATNTLGVTLGIYQVGPLAKYEITCRVPPALDETALAAAVVEALTLELVDRIAPRGVAPTGIPPWLTAGLTGIVFGQAEALSAVARRAAGAARPPEIRDILQRTSVPADATDRELFRANAWLVTDGLLRLPGGGAKLRRFLAEVPQGLETAFKADFPNPAAMEKWFSLEQARLSTLMVPENLTTTETARRLDQWLVFEGGRSFTGLARQAGQKWLRATLPARLLELQTLLGRAHPLYRPVLEAYLEAARWLAEERLSRYQRALARAAKLRQTVDIQVREIRDALDRAESNLIPALPVGSFQGLFETVEKLDEFERHRRNPISDYLDQFDK